MLQERTVTPVGSYRSYPVTVRVVTATNRDLKEEVRHGRFREDLYFRLHVIHLETTPLARRTSDIPLLAEAFLAQLAAEGLPQCRLTPTAVDVLSLAPWPGNIRQLRNLLEQAVIEAETPQISAELLRSLLADKAPDSESAWGFAETIVDDPAPLPKLAWSTLGEVERAPSHPYAGAHVLQPLRRRPAVGHHAGERTAQAKALPHRIAVAAGFVEVLGSARLAEASPRPPPRKLVSALGHIHSGCPSELGRFCRVRGQL